MTIIPDVSHWHIINNFTSAREYPFLIAKGTQGTNYVDTTLKAFIKGCEANNIPYWLYSFVTKGGEVNQAKYLVETCKNLVGDNFVGYILDVEKKNNADSVKNAVTWLSQNCEKCMLYTGYADYSLYSSVITSLPSNCKHWEARYGQNIGTYNSKYPCHDSAALHQYTSNAALRGVAGRCDASRVVCSDLSWFTSKTSKTTSNPYTAPTSVVKYGATGTSVKWVQWYLWKFGLLVNSKGVLSEALIDGKFGSQTESQVKEAQKKLGLVSDGIVGSKTIAAFKKVC